MKELNGISERDVINHPSGDLNRNVTGQDLIDDFDKHHVLFKSRYNLEYWRARKEEISTELEESKKGANSQLREKTILKKVGGRKRRTTKKISIIANSSLKGNALTLGGKTAIQLQR